MGNRVASGRWQLEFSDGEVVHLPSLASVRLTIAALAAQPDRTQLTRLAAGRYYYIDTFDTPAGPRPALVLVTRTTRPRVSRQPVEPARPFDAADPDGPTDGPHHGL
jgi:hypothetical protein